MSISRDSEHKRKPSGGRRRAWRNKRKFNLGRAAAMTKLITGKDQSPLIRTVRTRGGNLKFRALRLDSGNFSFGSESCARKTRIIQVVYCATSNELVRTNTLVKNAVVSIDANPFRQYFEKQYGITFNRGKVVDVETKRSNSVQKKQAERRSKLELDSAIIAQLSQGRVLACISSRPGQCGHADGYILEGEELQFYTRKMTKKKGKQ
ncbi:hypothetical protein PCE1_001522 [Barthelona sp. PCE]